MEIGVGEAAERLDLSQQRVRAMLADGRLEGRQVAGRWLIDESQLDLPQLASRPLSDRIARYLVLSHAFQEQLAAAGQVAAGPAMQRLIIDANRFNEARGAHEAAPPSSSAFASAVRFWSMWSSKLNQSAANAAVDADLDSDLHPSELVRVEKMLARLREGEPSSSVQLVRAWLHRRADRQLFAAAPPDVADLREDSRVTKSGISDDRAGMSAAGEAEGYVRAADLDELKRDYLLVKSSQPNVFLHVIDAPELPPAPVPPLLLIADLAEHGGARERSQAAHLLSAMA